MQSLIKKEAIPLRASKEWVCGRACVGKRKRKTISLYYSFKNKKTKANKEAFAAAIGGQ